MEIEVIPTLPGLLVAHYDEDSVNILMKRISEWTDINYVVQYLTGYKELLDSEFMRKNGFSSSSQDILKAARRIVNEAYELNRLLYDICNNLRTKAPVDLSSYFYFLDGVYANVWQLVPMKGYGPYNPSLLRLYAIKLDDGVYLIADGSIKLTKDMQDDLGLKAHVFNKIDSTKRFLKDNDIYRSEDV